ncbi:LPS export ABC transporter periplasmic protein LptC [Candidatus Pelagibacter sp.]|uniref:LPS export ABC transporter periplasmic protein LptC n=1 Tax=Candidatus Pelagibacter sp. TaxID=2024849 RepID=UPI003F84FE81
MIKKKLIRIILIILFSFFAIFIYSKFNPKKKLVQPTQIQKEEIVHSANIIQGVNYISQDLKGNEYIIKAAQGEIDLGDSNTIFLTDVSAVIKLKDKNNINITSNFGKYNIVNNDTIFSKNVIITYLDNKITGDYSDFSLERNSMIISKNVTYTNLENMLKADLIEMDIKTKNTKISMYEQEKKVNIKSND